MKLILAFVVSLIPLLIPQVLNAGGNIRWHDEGLSLVDDLKNVLVSAGKCATPEECSKRDLIFFRSVAEGLEVSLYELSSADREIVAKSVGICGYIAARNHMKSITFTVFALSKEKEMKRRGFFGERSVESYTIRGEYADR
jgi:hypothetical protein